MLSSTMNFMRIREFTKPVKSQEQNLATGLPRKSTIPVYFKLLIIYYYFWKLETLWKRYIWSCNSVKIFLLQKVTLPIPWAPCTGVPIFLHNSESEWILIAHTVITETEHKPKSVRIISDLSSQLFFIFSWSNPRKGHLSTTFRASMYPCFQKSRHCRLPDVSETVQVAHTNFIR